MFETPSRYLFKVLTWHTKNISGRELNAPYIKHLLQFMFVFTRKASGFFNTLISVFTHDASDLYTIQRRKKRLHPLPGNYCCYCWPPTTAPFPSLLETGTTISRAPLCLCAFSSSPLPHKLIRSSKVSNLPVYKKIHHSILIGRSLLRPRLVPKNFHLEKCVFPFGHIYGALNVIKQ